MASKFIEDTIDAIYTALTDNTNGVNAKIESINNELPDMVLPDIEIIYKGRMFLLDQMPCLVIWPEDSPGDEHTNNFYITHFVTVWVCVTGWTDQEEMHKAVWRYLRAITESVRATTNLDDEVDICHFIGHRYDGPWYGEQENTYIEVGGARFEIRKEELSE